jgi:hypothetical protein
MSLSASRRLLRACMSCKEMQVTRYTMPTTFIYELPPGQIIRHFNDNYQLFVEVSFDNGILIPKNPWELLE